jgi:predicted transcriptional regulator
LEEAMQLDVNELVAENKLLILYIMDKFSFDLTNSQIARLVVNIQEINYFYFQQYISQLVDDKLLACKVDNNKRLYNISQSGRQALDYFKTMIRASTRSKIDAIIKESIPCLRTENQITADYIPINENEYTVTCKISEGSTTLINLDLYAGTKEQAKSICRNWETNAREIYSSIIQLLTDIR